MSPGLPMFIAWNQMVASAALLGLAVAGLCWAHANQPVQQAADRKRRVADAARRPLPPSAAANGDGRCAVWRQQRVHAGNAI
jgi:hypothetical protein